MLVVYEFVQLAAFSFHRDIPWALSALHAILNYLQEILFRGTPYLILLAIAASVYVIALIWSACIFIPDAYHEARTRWKAYTTSAKVTPVNDKLGTKKSKNLTFSNLNGKPAAMMSLSQLDNIGRKPSKWKIKFYELLFAIEHKGPIILFEFGYIPVLRLCLICLQCDEGTNALTAYPDLTCWDDTEHVLLTGASILLGAYLYAATLYHALHKGDTNPDIQWVPRFDVAAIMTFGMLVAAEAYAPSSLERYVWALVICLATLTFATIWVQPCLTSSFANHARSATMAAATWCSICALVTLYTSSSNSMLTVWMFIIGSVPCMILGWFASKARDAVARRKALKMLIRVADITASMTAEEALSAINTISNLALDHSHRAKLRDHGAPKALVTLARQGIVAGGGPVSAKKTSGQQAPTKFKFENQVDAAARAMANMAVDEAGRAALVVEDAHFVLIDALDLAHATGSNDGYRRVLAALGNLIVDPVCLDALNKQRVVVVPALLRALRVEDAISIWTPALIISASLSTKPEMATMLMKENIVSSLALKLSVAEQCSTEQEANLAEAACVAVALLGRDSSAATAIVGSNIVSTTSRICVADAAPPHVTCKAVRVLSVLLDHAHLRYSVATDTLEAVTRLGESSDDISVVVACARYAKALRIESLALPKRIKQVAEEFRDNMEAKVVAARGDSNRGRAAAAESASVAEAQDQSAHPRFRPKSSKISLPNLEEDVVSDTLSPLPNTRSPDTPTGDARRRSTSSSRRRSGSLTRLKSTIGSGSSSPMSRSAMASSAAGAGSLREVRRMAARSRRGSDFSIAQIVDSSIFDDEHFFDDLDEGYHSDSAAQALSAASSLDALPDLAPPKPKAVNAEDLARRASLGSPPVGTQRKRGSSAPPAPTATSLKRQESHNGSVDTPAVKGGKRMTGSRSQKRLEVSKPGPRASSSKLPAASASKPSVSARKPAKQRR